MTAAEAFYKSVVGWSTAPFGDAGMPYTLWNRPDGVPMGGLMTLPDELRAAKVPPHWSMYVGVNKLEDGAARVKQLGGSAVSPVIDVPNVGRMQMMKDPQGAAFYIYEPAAPPQAPEGPPAVGDTSWIELYTTDNEAAMKFYGDLFGWQPTEAMDMGPMGVYRMFGRTGQSMGGMMAKTPDMAHIPNAWLPYFLVPDVHAAAERIKALSGRVIMGPMEVPGGSWVLQAQDPQGGTFALHHLKR
jgi:predicted enzyme related to lactoylglutathione lyase